MKQEAIISPAARWKALVGMLWEIGSNVAVCAGLYREHSKLPYSDSNGRMTSGKTTGQGIDLLWRRNHKNDSHSPSVPHFVRKLPPESNF